MKTERLNQLNIKGANGETASAWGKMRSVVVDEN